MIRLKCANSDYSKDFVTYPSIIKLGRGKYCSKKCSDKFTLIKKGQHLSVSTEFSKGEKPHNYKGWTTTKPRSKSGRYKLIYLPKHPKSTKKGYVREHRLVCENRLGRYLKSYEIVHHIDEDKMNNKPENLQVMTKREHDRMSVKTSVHRRWLND